MLQIKTIYEQSAPKFDEGVNTALADGWHLTRRDMDDRGFYAELEKVVITEKERTCDNCKYGDQPGYMEPCTECEDVPNEYPTGWEPIE